VKFISKPTYIKSQTQFSNTLHKFDDLDMKLLYELTKDGSISVPILSQKLDINASVLYSRIKRLQKKKLIKKFTVEIDASLLGIGVKATVGINRDPKLKDEIHNQLKKILLRFVLEEPIILQNLLMNYLKEGMHLEP